MISKNTKQRLYTSLILLSLVLLSIKFSFLINFILIIFGVLSTIETLAITKKLFNKKSYKFLLSSFLKQSNRSISPFLKLKDFG